MTIDHLIAFNIALFVTISSPGPAFLVAVQTTLSAGRRSGIVLGLGLGVMATVWLTFAILGLEALFQLVPWAYTVTKVIGAVYLIYIALKMWLGARNPLENTHQRTGYMFAQGVLVNALNPKSALFAAAVFLVIFPEDMTFWDNVTVALNQFIVEVSFYSVLAFCMSAQAVKQKYLKARLYIDRSASVILGGLGIRLLMSK